MDNALKEFASATKDTREIIKVVMNASLTVRMAVRTDLALDPICATVLKVVLYKLFYVRNILTNIFLNRIFTRSSE